VAKVRTINFNGHGSKRSTFSSTPRPCCDRNIVATGIRVGELVTLRLRDWRDDDGSFLVCGKGSRQRLALLPDDRSLKAVRMYLLHRTAMTLGHDGLILNASGGRISTQGVARILAQAADGAKVSTRVTPHMIRHTVATMLLRYGADIRVVQEVLDMPRSQPPSVTRMCQRSICSRLFVLGTRTIISVSAHKERPGRKFVMP